MSAAIDENGDFLFHPVSKRLCRSIYLAVLWRVGKCKCDALSRAGSHDLAHPFHLFHLSSQVDSQYAVENIIFCPMRSNDERRISDEEVAEEKKIMENIRDISGERLRAVEVRKLKETFLSRSGWAFILPAGFKVGSGGGLTANCFNLRYGPFALRVITKSEEELQTQLFRLSEMRNNPLNDENMREDQAWQREAQALNQICSQLCGLNMRIDQDDKTIKSWRSSRDVKILPCLLPFLNKVWVYVGNGEDIIKDRLFIRGKLNSWVAGKIPPDDKETVVGSDTISLQAALEPFDLWIPCDMLDEYCCLSDIPGVFFHWHFTRVLQ